MNRQWCSTVQIICKDGTTIQCRDFEATDSGVLFFLERPGREETEEENEDEEAERRASGFVPVTELQFVLPDEMTQQGGHSASVLPRNGLPRHLAGVRGWHSNSSCRASPVPRRPRNRLSRGRGPATVDRRDPHFSSRVAGVRPRPETGPRSDRPFCIADVGDCLPE